MDDKGMNFEAETKDSLVEYRLSQIEQRLDRQIEKKLDKLIQAIEEAKLQQRDIVDIRKDTDENREAINAHEKRIAALERAPLQQRADNWQKVLDAIFKGAVSIIGLSLMAYIGLRK